MRILFLTDRLSHKGGAPHHLLDVIRDMAKRHSVIVAAGSVDADVQLPTEVVRIRGLGMVTAGDTGLAKLGSLLEQAQVIHVQNLMNPTALQAAVATRRALITIQDHRLFCPGPGRTLPDGRACDVAMSDTACSRCLPDSDYRRRLLSLTQERAAAIGDAPVVVLSRYMKAELEQAGVGNITVIPPPVPAATQPSEPGTGFVLGGRLVGHKGVEMAHQAWQDSGTRHPLLLAGSGSATAALTGATDLGWLDREALRDQLAQARALLFPTRWQEPFGILGAEALAMGTPVIAMNRGGVADWAHTGCIQVPADDVPSMAAAIRTLDADDDTVHTLGVAGWSWVREHLDPERLHPQLEDLYYSFA